MLPYLLIEDDGEIATNIESCLRSDGYIATKVSDGFEALALIGSHHYAFIILDIILPGVNGWMLLEEMNRLNIRTPVIITSGLSSCENRIQGLQMGAQEFLTKPFSCAELRMKIRKIIFADRLQMEIQYKDLSLNRIKRKASILQKDLNVTDPEFRTLELLVANREKIITRQLIAERIYGLAALPNTNLIDVMVCRLRTKINDAGNGFHIRTIRGVGYQLSEC